MIRHNFLNQNSNGRRGAIKTVSMAISTVFLRLIRGYQLLVSPWLGSCCRFYPSCSEYGYQAFSHYQPLKAFFLTIRRLCKCHPFCQGGVDELPLFSSCSKSK